MRHDDAPPPAGPRDYGSMEAPRGPKFVLEPFEAIKFAAQEEWLVKHILPRQGFVSLYGASQSFKSFVVSHLAMHVALGWEWAARRVKQSAAVYIAAEGAAGLRKRKVGFELTHAKRLPEKSPVLSHFGLAESRNRTRRPRRTHSRGRGR